MEFEFDYKVVQLGVENIDGKDILTEIRFNHLCWCKDNPYEVRQRFYVAPIKYETGKSHVLFEDVNKELIKSEIQDSLGLDQIKHMESLLIEDVSPKNIENPNKKYVNVEL